MARWILTVLLIVLLHVLVGCGGVDTGRAQLVPAASKEALVALSRGGDVGESDVVEQMVVHRSAYRRTLELLVDHYNETGDNMKFMWAERELAALDDIPQYNYIIEASVAGANLRASTAIPEADYMYRDAMELEEKAKWLIVTQDEDKLRLALDKYNQLIRKHPSSDKIDDAAYQAGEIYEYFKDYTIAILYYKRCYQWNADTIYPARFRAAFILDRRLHRREEALSLYQDALGAIKRAGEHEQWKEFAERRIREMTETGGSVETE
ncbi:MAG: hypothetical protein JSV82_01970 [Planctomycetota bacterium]|nr:MAG: hypothetical protein JSV82_01970 [Planctomycetota bacterium]